MRAPLFSLRERTDSRPAQEGESTFQSLDRIAGPFWNSLRELLERWFANYPDSGAADLAERLRGDNDEFAAAWWELYLHQILKASGRSLTPHPEVPGTSKRPDFLVEEPSLETWYLEATILASDEDSASAREAAVVDALNAVENPNFFVSIRWEATGVSSLPVRGLRPRIETWLGSLDADALCKLEPRSLEDLPQLAWEHEGWRVVFFAIPKRPDARGKRARLVGAQMPAVGTWLNEGERVQRALDGKAKKYGDLPRPYVLGLRTTSVYAEFDDVASADGAGSLVLRGGTTFERRVSGVIVAGPELQPWSIGSVTPVFVPNAKAARALDVRLPWPTVARAEDLGAKGVDPAELDALLGIPADFRELKKNPFPRDGE